MLYLYKNSCFYIIFTHIYTLCHKFTCISQFDTNGVTFSHGSTLLGVVYGRKLSLIKPADVFLSVCIKSII